MSTRGPAGDRGRRAFFGWKVVVVAFFTALFSWGLGFYGTGIYLVELRAQHGVADRHGDPPPRSPCTTS